MDALLLRSKTRSVSFRRSVLTLGAWTLFLWLTRLKNALGDDTMSHGGRTAAVLLSAAFVAAAGAVGLGAWRGRRGARGWAIGFAAVSIVYWLVRVGVIVARDHSIGFTIVHAVLAAITVVLAAWVVRAAGVPRAGSLVRGRTG